MSNKVAVVTGANKGIGFAIVEKLCSELQDGIIYLTARNRELGKQALEKVKSTTVLNRKCKDVRFFELDITKRSTIESFKEHLQKEHNGFDILINNAAICYKVYSWNIEMGQKDNTPFAEQAEKTMATNYFGTKAVCDILFPILKPHARVVNISSESGYLEQVTNSSLREKFNSPTLSYGELDALVNQFIEAAETGTDKKLGFSHDPYGMSKVATTALTSVQQGQFDSDPRQDIVVNACCPGFVATDMTSYKGPLKPIQGAETPVYLAFLPENVKRPKGAFLQFKKEVNWMNGQRL